MMLSSTKYSPVVDVACNIGILFVIVFGVCLMPVWAAYAICVASEALHDARERTR